MSVTKGQVGNKGADAAKAAAGAGNVGAGAAGAGKVPNGEGTTHARHPAVGIASMVRRYSNEGILDAAASDYLQNVRKVLEDPAHTLQIKTTKLSDNTFAFSSGKYSVVMMIDTALSAQYGELIREVSLNEASRAFRESFGKEQHLINIICINKFSYNKYPQAAAYITRTLSAKVDKGVANFTVSDFTSQFVLNIDTDTVTVRNFMEQHSPNAVSCNSFGFVANLGQQSQARPGQTQNLDNVQPFFGVTSYVEFIREPAMPGTPVKFTPVIHITEIVSVIPTAEILSMAIPIAAEVFITNGLWKQPFINLNDKNGINIGNLIMDANKKPWRATSELELVEFFQKHIGAPLLCLDIIGGTASIPGIQKFAKDQFHASLVSDLSRFLETDPHQFQMPIAKTIFSEVTGIAEVSRDLSPTGLIDSRELNYLFAVAKIGHNQSVEKLKYRFPDPGSRMENIRESMGIPVTPLGYGLSCMLTGRFVQTCSAAIASKMNIVMPTSSLIPSISLTGMSNQNYSNGSMFSPVAGVGSSNFGGWYNM